MATKPTTPEVDPARLAVRKLLSQGEASPSEAAKLAGVSRQLVNHWAAGINWRKARNARLVKAWNKAMRSARL